MILPFAFSFLADGSGVHRDQLIAMERIMANIVDHILVAVRRRHGLLKPRGSRCSGSDYPGKLFGVRAGQDFSVDSDQYEVEIHGIVSIDQDESFDGVLESSSI